MIAPLTTSAVLPGGVKPELTIQGLIYSDPSFHCPLVNLVKLLPQRHGSRRILFTSPGSSFASRGCPIICATKGKCMQRIGKPDQSKSLRTWSHYRLDPTWLWRLIIRAKWKAIPKWEHKITMLWMAKPDPPFWPMVIADGFARLGGSYLLLTPRKPWYSGWVPISRSVHLIKQRHVGQPESFNPLLKSLRTFHGVFLFKN